MRRTTEITLTKEAYRALKELANKEGKTVQQVGEELINEYIARIKSGQHPLLD